MDFLELLSIPRDVGQTPTAIPSPSRAADIPTRSDDHTPKPHSEPPSSYFPRTRKTSNTSQREQERKLDHFIDHQEKDERQGGNSKSPSVSQKLRSLLEVSNTSMRGKAMDKEYRLSGSNPTHDIFASHRRKRRRSRSATSIGDLSSEASIDAQPGQEIDIVVDLDSSSRRHKKSKKRSGSQASAPGELINLTVDPNVTQRPGLPSAIGRKTLRDKTAPDNVGLDAAEAKVASGNLTPKANLAESAPVSLERPLESLSTADTLNRSPDSQLHVELTTNSAEITADSSPPKDTPAVPGVDRRRHGAKSRGVDSPENDTITSTDGDDHLTSHQLGTSEQSAAPDLEDLSDQEMQRNIGSSHSAETPVYQRAQTHSKSGAKAAHVEMRDAAEGSQLDSAESETVPAETAGGDVPSDEEPAADPTSYRKGRYEEGHKGSRMERPTFASTAPVDTFVDDGDVEERTRLQSGLEELSENVSAKMFPRPSRVEPRKWKDTKEASSITKGRFTAKEDEALKDRMLKYFQDNGMSWDEGMKALMHSEKRGSEKRGKDSGGAGSPWLYIAACLPNRHVESVIQHIQGQFVEWRRKGDWLLSEEYQLVELVLRNGSKASWKMIGGELGRYWKTCRDHFEDIRVRGRLREIIQDLQKGANSNARLRQLGADTTAYRKKMRYFHPWRPAEDRFLLDLLRSTTKVEWPLKSIPWRYIHQAFVKKFVYKGNPSTLRTHYLNNMLMPYLNNDIIKHLPSIYKRQSVRFLLKVLERQPDIHWSEVSWDDTCLPFFPAAMLRKYAALTLWKSNFVFSLAHAINQGTGHRKFTVRATDPGLISEQCASATPRAVTEGVHSVAPPEADDSQTPLNSTQDTPSGRGDTPTSFGVPDQPAFVGARRAGILAKIGRETLSMRKKRDDDMFRFLQSGEWRAAVPHCADILEVARYESHDKGAIALYLKYLRSTNGLDQTSILPKDSDPLEMSGFSRKHCERLRAEEERRRNQVVEQAAEQSQDYLESRLLAALDIHENLEANNTETTNGRVAGERDQGQVDKETPDVPKDTPDTPAMDLSSVRESRSPHPRPTGVSSSDGVEIRTANETATPT